MRVVIGEDSVLLREGIARILAEAGFDVVAQAGDATVVRGSSSRGRFAMGRPDECGGE